MAFRSAVSFLIFFSFGDVFSSSEDCGQTKPDNSLSFPWNVGIYIENQNQLELICFGSVIHANGVLTAAHCFCDIDGNIRNASFYIATGNLKKSVDPKTQSTTLHKINKSNIIINRYYKGLINTFSNDLAIVKAKFQFNDKIKPVCIDMSGFIKDKNSEGKQAIWDKTKTTIADQTYLDSEDCSSDAPKDFAPFVTNDKSCVKTKVSSLHLNHESEGGGLIFPNPEDKRWYLKGVISMHEPTQGRFSTYTSVNQYLNWISNIYVSL